jgi:ribonuclease R
MTQIPSKAEILDWITAHPTLTAKRDIAKAFGIKGAARIELKRVLKELEDEGHLSKRKKTYRERDNLPPVTLLQMMAPTSDGDLFARPIEWQGEGEEPIVLMTLSPSDPALGYGDRVLGKVQAVQGEQYQYVARIIRRIGEAPNRVLGVFRKTAEGGRIVPIDKSGKEWMVPEAGVHGAKDGELVEAQQFGGRARMGLPKAKIVDRLGDPSAPKAVSLIAIHQHGIPDNFPEDVINDADAQKPAGTKGREDWRDVPLVTIDPHDARDHDDACFAEPDTDPQNPGGHIITVAIADVAHYVTPNSPLDREAWKRGNSTYFPDRVVPMLPDRLSGDLCSLHEGVPRAALAVKMRITAEGEKIGHSFHRILMKSAASLNYEEVQAAMDGAANDRVSPLLEPVIRPLYDAHRTLVIAREKRQPLDLDLPERKVILSDDGKVSSVAFRDRLDAHRLIEEFMVLANVAAAETLIEKKTPLLFRVHEEPSPDKLDALRETANAAGLVLAKGQVLRTKHLNQLLKQAKGTDEAELINMSTLRSMTQAYYAPQNFGHFGLALRNYAHFTSPIRRYADLIVHRGLITAHGWGKDGLTPDMIERLEETGNHISTTERRSMVAERDTVDRYLAAYLSERMGNEFDGRISGVAKFGVFVRIDDSGADGIIPIRSLGREFFHYDAGANTLIGSDTGLILTLGMRVTVRLTEAEPIAGGIAFELLSVNDAALPKGPRKFSKTSKKKMALAKKKDAKVKRKVQRRRK